MVAVHEEMTPLDRYHQLLEETRTEVAATLPPGRTRTLLALLHVGDRTAFADDLPQAARPGWNLSLRFCLEQQGDEDGDFSADRIPADRAERFLADCDQLARAGSVLAQCASGHLQLQQHAPRTFVAWATSRRLSPDQRERADFDGWSAQVARQVAPHMATLRVERDQLRVLHSNGDTASDPAVAHQYRQLGQAHVARFAPQRSYPDDAEIGGATFAQYAAILSLLIGWLYREHEGRAPGSNHLPTPQNERGMIAALADALNADPEVIGQALPHFILDRDNAAYHSALPGCAAPPLIRLDKDRVVWSARGLLSEPLLFLARELRRRHAQEYHNRATLREGVFRHDLYHLFGDKRFALSAGRVELKRSGEARTDLDALVFDRKTGTLGVFELKAQDPFARSVEERQRQRDNFLRANRQVSAILEWVQHHGPDDLLARFDERAAKRFRVQKVYVFVLGRYLAHFVGGPEPDRRAAWGSWPQVLHIAGDGPFDPDSRNPLGTLFARLQDATTPGVSPDAARQEIVIGDLRLRLYPSFADMRAGEDRPA